MYQKEMENSSFSCYDKNGLVLRLLLSRDVINA